MSAWVPFGAAILGAAVGGLGATVGGWFLARTEHVREQRVAIFTELLPSLPEPLRGHSRTELAAGAEPQLRAIAYRALAIPSDAEHGSRLLGALHEREAGRRMLENDGHGRWSLTDDGEAKAGKATDDVVQAVNDLESQLRRKLPGRRGRK